MWWNRSCLEPVNVFAQNRGRQQPFNYDCSKMLKLGAPHRSTLKSPRPRHREIAPQTRHCLTIIRFRRKLLSPLAGTLLRGRMLICLISHLFVTCSVAEAEAVHLFGRSPVHLFKGRSRRPPHPGLRQGCRRQEPTLRQGCRRHLLVGQGPRNLQSMGKTRRRR